jgi:hypothetical protein
MNQFPLGPWVSYCGHFKFVWKFASVNDTGDKLRRCHCYRWLIIVGVIDALSGIFIDAMRPAINLSPVSTTHAIKMSDYTLKWTFWEKSLYKRNCLSLNFSHLLPVSLTQVFQTLYQCVTMINGYSKTYTRAWHWWVGIPEFVPACDTDE